MRTLLYSGLVALLAQNLSAHGTVRASLSPGGVQGNAESMNPALSGNGRYVAFSSDATNFAVEGPFDTRDVFVKDLETGAIERVAEDADYPSISGDGRLIAYGDPSQYILYVFDRQTDLRETIGLGRIPHISDDGRRVVYELNGSVYMLDRPSHVTYTVAAGNTASYEPSISRNGRYVGFHSEASDLVPGDTNGQSDAFVYEARTGTTHMVSVSGSGVQGDNQSRTVTVANDGTAIFRSAATNLVAGDTTAFPLDYFVHSPTSGTTEFLLPVQGDGDMNWPVSISEDGRFVAFDSSSRNLVPGTDGAWNIFVYDRTLGLTTWASRGPTYPGTGWWTARPSISADGSRVSYFSGSRKLVRHDTNGVMDVFVWSR